MATEQTLLDACVSQGLLPREEADRLLSECGGDAARVVERLRQEARILPAEWEALRTLAEPAPGVRPKTGPRFGRFEILQNIGENIENIGDTLQT